MRVYELAKEAELSNKEFLDIIEEDLGITGKTHSSSLTDEQVIMIRDELGLMPGQQRDKESVDLSLPPEEAAVQQEETAVAAEEAEDAEPESPEDTAGPEDQLSAPEPVEEASPGQEEQEEDSGWVEITGPIVVRDLAEKLGMKPNVMIAELMKMNIFASITQTIDAKTAKKLAEKHGFETKKPEKKAPAAPPPPPTPASDKKKKKKKKDKKEAAVKREKAPGEVIRPPIVAFLGHVDHGKTSLLDYIRKTRVVAGESGGITQHIGAYTVEFGDHKITFLDTPGHSAFEKMRERGAQLTDIMVLVVAADDGIMPQTDEAIKHARNAGSTVIVAINKMDLPAADPMKIKTQLQQRDMATEDWGGDLGVVEVSAQTGQGIDELLERINLEAEMLELTAMPSGKAEGYVVEAQMEPGMGPTASLLVRTGALKVGDGIVCGKHYGKIKSLINDRGERIKSAGPSMAVKCLGLTSVPEPGDEWETCKSDREARKIAEETALLQEEIKQQEGDKKLSLDDLFAQAGMTEVKELAVVVKGDTQGSVEAIRYNLEAIESDKVTLKIVDASVGNISNKDIMLASASNAVVLGFHVGVESGINSVAKREGVEVRLYSIIYEMIDNVAAAMKGLLEPVLVEENLGRAEVRATFPVGKRGKVAGCLVVEGRMAATAKVRIRRGRDIIYEGSVVSLRRYQDSVREVSMGQECGIQFDRFNNIEEGDVIEAYNVKRVEQEL